MKAIDEKLIKACEEDDLNAVNSLIQVGADVNVITDDVFEMSLLHGVIMSGNEAIALALIAAGADVNQVNLYGFDALYEAIIKNNPNIVQALVKAGANINKINQYDHSRLKVAMDNLEDPSNMVSTLIDLGADINIDKDLLQQATRQGNIEIISTLLRAGADINEVDNATLLDTAIKGCNDKEVILFLIAMHADVNVADCLGETPLNLCWNIESIRLALIRAGADVNIANNCGEIPLHRAAGYSDLKACVDLIKAGSNIDDRIIKLITQEEELKPLLSLPEVQSRMQEVDHTRKALKSLSMRDRTPEL